MNQSFTNVDEFKRFVYIFHLLANRMDAYAGDLFLDFSKSWDMYLDRSDNARFPIILMHRHHADELSRYESILRDENKPCELSDCLELCQRTLGADYMVEITPFKVIITNFRESERSIEDFVCRLNDLRSIGEVEVVNYHCA